MAQGLKRDKVLDTCGVSKSQVYYRCKAGKPGRKPSQHTLQAVNGEVVRRDNRYVKDYMKS